MTIDCAHECVYPCIWVAELVHCRLVRITYTIQKGFNRIKWHIVVVVVIVGAAVVVVNDGCGSLLWKAQQSRLNAIV